MDSDTTRKRSEFMKPVINLLVQLEEFLEIEKQKKTMSPAAPTDGLSETIKTLSSKLPRDIRSQFEKLRRKGMTAVVPISDGLCSGCGISLPRGVEQAARSGDDMLMCPNCTRMLYRLPEGAPRQKARQTQRFAPAKVGIARFSAPGLMIPNMEATTMEEAISELCTQLETEEFIEEASVLQEKALLRESIMSTSVDHGLAFPHVRGVEGGGLTLALGICPKGIRFSTESKLLTRIIFFLAIPTAASSFYLKLLSGLSETFMQDDAREKLLAAEGSDKLWKALLSTTRRTVK